MLRRMLRSERLAAVGTMAAGLAHEVRNPLNSASLQLTLLERRLARGEGAAEVLPIAEIIKSEIDRLDRLVRDFLAFSQPRPLDVKSRRRRDAAVSSVAGLIAPDAEAARRHDRDRGRARPAPDRGRPGAPAPGPAEPDPQRHRGHARPRRAR